MANTGLNALLSAMMIGLMYMLGYHCQQDNFWPLLGTYTAFFGTYALVLKTAHHPGWLQWYLFLGIGLRAMLLFSLPNLSDDVYRYIWDGKLWLNGINPFVHTPNYYLHHSPLPSGLSEGLYFKLNSPYYHTIYPPVAQGIFTVCCSLFPKDLYATVISMKVVSFLAELGSLRLFYLLLQRFNLPAKHILIYALNPLIILELIGNVHLEGLMVLFVLLAIYLLIKGQNSWGALAMAGSIASKLLPLMFLPFFIRRWGWPKKSLLYFSLIGGVLMLLFLPMLSLDFLRGFGSSLDLYFQKFEFNAGLYYLLRWVFQVLTGYNFIIIIGPALGLLTIYAIFRLVKAEVDLSWERLPLMMLVAFSCYLFSATIIHPWYIALPLALCILTPLRFPVLWSGLVVLSYSHYNDGLFQENYALIAFEYILLVIFMLVEIKHQFPEILEKLIRPSQK